jgi:chaperonin GroES
LCYIKAMKPKRDVVLILADKAEEKTASGLYIKEDWKTLPPTGTVEAVGPDVKDTKVGDRVVFERYGSVILKHDRRLCQEKHILATVEDVEEDVTK